jgi:hypothetical protein
MLPALVHKGYRATRAASASQIKTPAATIGYPFFPLFVSGLVPGLGWALVLLAVTLAAGPRGRHCPMCHRLVPTGRTTCDGCNYDFVDRKVYAS